MNVTDTIEIPGTHQELIEAYLVLYNNYIELEKRYNTLHIEHLLQKEQLADLRRSIFGQRRERYISTVENPQLELALGLDDVLKEETTTTEQITYQRTIKKKSYTPHSRHALPSDLPRVDHIIEPEEDVEGLRKIGEEITEELEYEPGKFYVNRYIRPKYAREDGDGVITGNLPDRPIDKGIPGPGLLSHIMISKYVDHLPLYRQRQQFSRVGVELSGSTVDNWIRYTSDLLQPLYDLYRERILSREYLMVDETPIRVRDREKKGKTHQGYFWVYYDPLDKEVLFNYHPSRSRASPNKLLRDFQGYLQTDGYTVYDEIGSRQGITLLHCWAHARRYFVKAQKNHREHSEWILDKIQSLYKIERRIKEKEPEECYKVRQSESLPILNEIKIWLDKNINEVLPKSSLGKALGYLLGHWKGLTRYIEDGRLQIDNNPIENTIRPVALGRKNYLFAGSHAGAHRSAMIYTIVLNAKIHDIEPFTYLKELISRISNHPYKKLHELLPAQQGILLNNLK